MNLNLTSIVAFVADVAVAVEVWLTLSERENRHRHQTLLMRSLKSSHDWMWRAKITADSNDFDSDQIVRQANAIAFAVRSRALVIR